MSWRVRDLWTSPETVRALCEQGVASLGPGPRGLTITHRRMLLNPLMAGSAYGPDITRTYQLEEVIDVDGFTRLHYVHRAWAE